MTLPKHDPFNQYTSAKYQGIVKPKKRKHEEATLHLQFCGWIKTTYPDLMFVRHEKERARGLLTSNLMQKYNNLDGLPDFESIVSCGAYFGLYIEFKKPGEYWLEKNSYVKKAYQHQYECHVKLWQQGRCAYFCNDLEVAKWLLTSYLNGVPYPMQVYPVYNRDLSADLFFNDK